MASLNVSILFCLLLSIQVFTSPLPGAGDNNVEDGGRIDLSHLGDKIYGQPSDRTGNRVANWNPETSNQNPEELGEYAEGDILVPTDGARNGLRSEATRWPNGIIPYVIEGSYASEHRDNIMKAIADYSKLTCIRFVPYKGETDYLVISGRKTGCWSSVGRIGGRQEVNLQNPGCVTSKGTVIHELMHAAGFLHEQSRNERDKYVTVNFHNIKQGQDYNFNKASKESTNDFGIAYDYNSVMHYGEFAFSSNSQPTLVPKVSGVKIGQRVGLSRSDVEKLNAMYKCKNHASPSEGWIGAIWSGIFGH